MRFGPDDWKNVQDRETRCFLLTNGLGGYCSLTVTGAVSRGDHALLMAAEKAPNFRYHYITALQETVELTGEGITEPVSYELSAQSYVTSTKNQQGHELLQIFEWEGLPVWVYQAGPVTVRKQLVMVHEENTVGISWRIRAPRGIRVRLLVRPLLRFAAKNSRPGENQAFAVEEHTIRSDGRTLYYRTNGSILPVAEERIRDLYFFCDARDGRDAAGSAVINHEVVFEAEDGNTELELLYSDHPVAQTLHTEDCIQTELRRISALQECAGLQHPAARNLVRCADQFLVKRESTGGDSIIAGYPFFGDWGRDTMIAVTGCAALTGQFERARSILGTFAAYCRRGLMPNLFPEGEDAPVYNTADASLWFIEAVYEYKRVSGDAQFFADMLPVMEEIISWYRRGTDYHIFMDTDGLVSAGAGEEQVTWMDVRFGDILPTPRHGKTVEINALWYNALCILAEAGTKEQQTYRALAAKTRQSFVEKFWMEEKGYLRDVLSLEEECRYAQEQLRCNQVWALSLPYSMMDARQACRILDKIEEKLYTSYGLRTLAPEDPEFHPFCTGSQYERDMAYHQGTVWVYPLGAYLRAKLRWEAPQRSRRDVMEKLRIFETCFREGCIGQAAEIYDGKKPVQSRGCYAQAWSAGEMLAVYYELEK